MNRPNVAWVVAAVALVVGVLGGLGIGFALSDGGGSADGQAAGSAAVPEPCRAAIDEARTELNARQEALAIPDQLAVLLERTGAAVVELDTAELETILLDLESLARDAGAVAAELRTSDFEDLARECEAASDP